MVANQPLVMLTHPTDSPCSYKNAEGVCEGTDIEFAHAIAAKMGRPLTVRAVKFEQIIPQLKAGKADFGIATVAITEARKCDVDFSKPYSSSGNCFLYRTGVRSPRMSQITSSRIGVETGTTGDLYLCRHGCDPVRFGNMHDAVMALEKGEVDAVFFDAIPLKRVAEKSGGRFAVSALEQRESYGVAVNKQRADVLAAANAVIAEGRGPK